MSALLSSPSSSSERRERKKTLARRFDIKKNTSVSEQISNRTSNHRSSRPSHHHQSRANSSGRQEEHEGFDFCRRHRHHRKPFPLQNIFKTTTIHPLIFTPHSKNEKTYLGGTNAFSPSMPPPCDPGACAYA